MGRRVCILVLHDVLRVFRMATDQQAEPVRCFLRLYEQCFHCAAIPRRCRVDEPRVFALQVVAGHASIVCGVIASTSISGTRCTFALSEFAMRQFRSAFSSTRLARSGFIPSGMRTLAIAAHVDVFAVRSDGRRGVVVRKVLHARLASGHP